MFPTVLRVKTVRNHAGYDAETGVGVCGTRCVSLGATSDGYVHVDVGSCMIGIADV